jgi:hypothetical protein
MHTCLSGWPIGTRICSTPFNFRTDIHSPAWTAISFWSSPIKDGSNTARARGQIRLGSGGPKVAEGELTPDEGAGVNAVINHYLKAVEITDLERRLKALEDRS